MYFIQIEARCIDEHFEVLLDEVKNAELTIEDRVGQILLDFFKEVVVDEVMIGLSPNFAEKQHQCSVYIQAHGSLEGSMATGDELERIERILEERISYALMELFGTVIVDGVMIRPPPLHIMM